MKSIAVFCGSSNGASEIYREYAVALGKALAEQEISLVYGGASAGLMGAVARIHCFTRWPRYNGRIL